jgi:hypothetical protein
MAAFRTEHICVNFIFDDLPAGIIGSKIGYPGIFLKLEYNIPVYRNVYVRMIFQLEGLQWIELFHF